MSKPSTLFKARKLLIGMVHVGALPGTPGSRLSVPQLADRAAAEASLLRKAGFDAIIVENMHDRPYVHQDHGPEIVAAMTAVVIAVRQAVESGAGRRASSGGLPIGIQVLSGGNREALGIALAAGLQFIRCENFVFAHVADEGLLPTAEAGPLLRYRRHIGAAHIHVMCDIKKKHASHAITADVSLPEAAAAAEFFGADGVIVSGTATGRPTDPDDVLRARQGCGLPVWVGSGVTPENIPSLIGQADALIVGSWLKKSGRWENPVDSNRAAAIVRTFRQSIRNR